MPRPPNTVRVTFVATLPHGEIAQTSFWCRAAEPITTDAQLQGFADAMAAAFVANSTTLRVIACPETRFTEVRVYDYPAAGPAPSQRIAVAPINLVGTGTEADALPLQCAAVVTTRTPLSGRRFRGRMYWPCTSNTLTDHQLAQGIIDGLADDVAAIMSAANAYAGYDVEAVVVSAVASQTTDIVRVEADSRVDIQRRRAESEAELRQGSAQLVVSGG